MGTHCNSPSGQEGTEVLGQAGREEAEAIVGCILAEEQRWGWQGDSHSCSGSHCQGWAPLRFPLHVSKALPGHPEGQPWHV